MLSDSEGAHPVPEDQQPLREYEQLRQSGFFRWVMLEPWTYARRLVWVGAGAGAIVAPIAAASFPPAKALGHLMLSVVGGALLLLSLVVLRLYLGWSYVGQRLSQQAVAYEESGWYDGEVWVKPPEELAKDRLLVDYQVRPILRRLYRTFIAMAAIAVAIAMLWPLV
jgi:hypothetical protein